MKIFDFEEIKAKADCRDIAVTMLGMHPRNRGSEWWSFNNPWRPGSDSGAFSVSERGYRDHVSDESGSVLDLVANAKYAGDIFQAQETLGEYLHLKSAMEAKQKRKFVCAYDYTDATGKLVHQTVRWDPKDFTQRRPDPAKPGEWIWSISGIEPVLYRLPELVATSWVCVVGGEKDADNLVSIGIPATTNPMGEGNWKDSYNQHFAGKAVIILPDRDDVGRKHAQVVAYAIKGVAKSIRIIELPFPDDVKPCKDPSDWIAHHQLEGHNSDNISANLKRLIKDTPVLDSATVEPPKSTQKQISDAKRANRDPFKNYDWNDVANDKGKETRVKEPRHINAMLEDISRRFWGFPRRVGSTLFDLDHNTGHIRLINAPQDLMAWIQEKSGHCVEWAKVDGATSHAEFFSSVFANSQYYELISGVPNWPKRDDVFYTHANLPEPDPEAKAFMQFCSFFSPATETDWHLLRAFIASPIYYKPKVDRPLWIIDATSGQGTGKTKLVEMVTLLYGGDDPECGEPLWVDFAQLNNETTLDRVVKRLLSAMGRKKRVALLDNVTGYFRSPALATLVTQGSISGMAPYGHGEETRPNDLTWVITSNSATLDRDLVDRSQIIKLKRPDSPAPRWALDVTSFIKANRLQVIADIIGILTKGPQFQFSPVTRFREWESDVLVPIMGNMDTYTEVFKLSKDRQKAADGDLDDALIIQDVIQEHINKLGLSPNLYAIWIPSTILTKWVSDAIPGFGGRNSRGAMAHIKNMIKVGLLKDLSDAIDIWPHHGTGRRRGLMMGHQNYLDGSKVKVLNMSTEGVISSEDTANDA